MKMKITILVDNCTMIGNYLYAEPALSFFIESQRKRILFDTGISDIFIKNAQTLGIDLLDIDYIIISHGHDDHIGGLHYLINLYKNCKPKKRPILIAHPSAFFPKFLDGNNVGNTLSEETINCYFDVKKSSEAIWITENLAYLGEIERNFPFEKTKAMGHIPFGDDLVSDFLIDDSALAYKSEKGLVIITGCSHSGICNIIETAKRICKENKIYDIIGGLHLLEPSEEKIRGTIDYIKGLSLDVIRPCHCTKLKYKIMLSNIANIEEVGSGAVVEY